MNAEQLKNSILQRAVEGTLVEQREEEGTAKELLAAIKAEKAKLVKEGKLKKEKPLPEIKAEEIPFEIPESWEWVRLGEIVTVYGGKRIPAGTRLIDKDTGHKYIRVSDMKNGTVSLDDIKYVPKEIYQQISRYTISVNDVYITVAGTIGSVGTIPNELNNANLTENADKLIIYDLNQKFVVHCLASPLIQHQIHEAITKVGQPKLAIMRIESLLFPLPPLAEQKRIVAKIEELLPHVEQYGKAHDELTALNEKFPDAMKKSVLQYAMEGKLVEQREEEGTAKELLSAIKAEKARLVVEGKLKKEKPLPEIKAEEIPFEIPESWEWVRLGEIIQISSGDGLTSKDMTNGNIPVFGGNGITGYHNVANITQETVVIGRVGFYCGSVHITPAKAWVTDNAFITTYPKNNIDRNYLVYILRHMNLGRNRNATAQPVVSGKKIYPILFPLPPLAEQKRIVAKIEELLACCGALGNESTA